jgi:hypothetical protein
MLCAYRQIHPGVFVVLIYRYHRMWKCWIGKCSERDSNHIFLRFQIVMNSCPAISAEMKRCLLPRVTGTQIRHSLASDLDVDPAEASLSAKRTSGTALTCRAVANRNSDRIPIYRGCKLTTTTGRCSNDHYQLSRLEPAHLTSQLTGAARKPKRTRFLSRLIDSLRRSTKTAPQVRSRKCQDRQPVRLVGVSNVDAQKRRCWSAHADFTDHDH